METIMNKIRYYVRGQWVDESLVRWVTTILIGVDLGLGIAILVGGMDRFQIPTYQPLIDMTSGKVWIWGLWIAFSGSLIMSPFKWINLTGLFLGMSWMYIWMGLFVVSVIRYPQSAATPMIAYGGFAMIHFAIIVARILERDDEKR